MKSNIQHSKQQNAKTIVHYTIYGIGLFLCFSLIDLIQYEVPDWLENAVKTLATIIVLVICSGLWRIYNKTNS